MSSCKSPTSSSGRLRKTTALLFALVVLSSLSCNDTTLVKIPEDPGAVQIDVSLYSDTPGQYAKLVYTWVGEWQENPTENFSCDSEDPGVGNGGPIVQLPPDQTDFTQFPKSGLLRCGLWEFTAKVEALDAADNVITSLVDGVCVWEVYTDKTIELLFSEGNTGCSLMHITDDP